MEGLVVSALATLALDRVMMVITGKEKISFWLAL